jgi:uncharacterized protein YqjF (DUF2071 family)
MAQTWEDLLFAHWEVRPAALRPVLPAALALDTFDGGAWIAITPFRVSGLRLRGLSPLPGLSAFPETNVRTYVSVDGRPGVYFLSLDAGSRVAVAAARRLYLLPYFYACFRVTCAGARVRYASQRRHRGAPTAEFVADYGPTGPVERAGPGSLAGWLTERYCFFTIDRHGGVRCAEIHHAPWPLQPADAEIARNTMLASLPVALEGRPILHFSRRLDVQVWPLVRAKFDRPEPASHRSR